MAIQLIAIDIDGTLINSNRQITPENKEAITQAVKNGVHIIVTTGRPYNGLASILTELELNKEGHYGISNNGALIHDAKTGDPIHKNLLTFEQYLEMEALARKLNVAFHCIANNQIYTANKDISAFTIHESHLTNTPLFYRAVEEMDPSLQFSKFMFSAKPEELDRAVADIPQELNERYNLVRSASMFLECLSHDASKGLAVKYVAEKLNISSNDVMVIGDQNNDISMFEYAGHRIAMGNAVDNLKDLSTFVTKSNNESGVAYAIDRFVLNK